MESTTADREQHVQRILRERIAPDLMQHMPPGRNHITEVEQALWEVVQAHEPACLDRYPDTFEPIDVDYSAKLIRQIAPMITDICGKETPSENTLTIAISNMVAKIGRPKLPKSMLPAVASVANVAAEATSTQHQTHLRRNLEQNQIRNPFPQPPAAVPCPVFTRNAVKETPALSQATSVRPFHTKADQRDALQLGSAYRSIPDDILVPTVDPIKMKGFQLRLGKEAGAQALELARSTLSLLRESTKNQARAIQGRCGKPIVNVAFEATKAIDIPLAALPTSLASDPSSSLASTRSHLHGESATGYDLRGLAEDISSTTLFRNAASAKPGIGCDWDPFGHNAVSGIASVLTPRKDHKEDHRARIQESVINQCRSSSPPAGLTSHDDIFGIAQPVQRTHPKQSVMPYGDTLLKLNRIIASDMPIMRSAESWAPVQMDALMIKSLEVPDLLINNVPNVAAGHHSSLSVAAEAQSQLGADIGLEADGERVHLPSLAKNLLRRSTKFGESLCVAEDLQDDLATFRALAVIAPPPQFQGSSRLPVPDVGPAVPPITTLLLDRPSSIAEVVQECRDLAGPNRSVEKAAGLQSLAVSLSWSPCNINLTTMGLRSVADIDSTAVPTAPRGSAYELRLDQAIWTVQPPSVSASVPVASIAQREIGPADNFAMDLDLHSGDNPHDPGDVQLATAKEYAATKDDFAERSITADTEDLIPKHLKVSGGGQQEGADSSAPSPARFFHMRDSTNLMLNTTVPARENAQRYCDSSERHALVDASSRKMQRPTNDRRWAQELAHLETSSLEPLQPSSCLIDVDELRDRVQARGFKNNELHLVESTALDGADVIISPRTCIVLRHLAALPTCSKGLSAVISALSERYARIILILRVNPGQLAHDADSDPDPWSPPVLQAHGSLVSAVKRARAITQETSPIASRIGSTVDILLSHDALMTGRIVRLCSQQDFREYHQQYDPCIVDEVFSQVERWGSVEPSLRLKYQNLGVNAFDAAIFAAYGSGHGGSMSLVHSRLDYQRFILGEAVTERLSALIDLSTANRNEQLSRSLIEPDPNLDQTRIEEDSLMQDFEYDSTPTAPRGIFPAFNSTSPFAAIGHQLYAGAEEDDFETSIGPLADLDLEPSQWRRYQVDDGSDDILRLDGHDVMEWEH